MSLNHLIDPLQNPKLDVYVGDIEADDAEIKNTLEAENVFVNNTLTADAVFASGVISTTNPDGTIFSPLIASNLYVNGLTDYENETYASNNYIYDSFTPNGWNSISNVKTFIDTSNTVSTFSPYIETYTIKLEGVVDNFAPYIFEFRSREGYEELMDIKCQVSNADGLGLGDWSSVSNVIRPPDNLDNDFQFLMPPVDYFATTTPTATSNAVLTIEIKVLIQPPLPPP
jgi:hypothetical protein